MSKNKLLEIKNLWKTHNFLNSLFTGKLIKESKDALLCNLHFDLYENEIVAIIGKNGAGKSTLLKIIMGFEDSSNPKANPIKYNFIFKNHPSEAMSLVFQKNELLKDLKVKDIVNFAIKNELDNKVDKKYIEKLIKLLEITKLLNKNFAVLSGGEMQRIVIFIALVSHPKIIMLDEFSNNLDIFVRENIQKFIKTYCKQNQAAAIIVSHSLEEVYNIADRIVFLHKGQIYDNFTINEKLSVEQLETIFCKIDKQN